MPFSRGKKKTRFCVLKSKERKGKKQKKINKEGLGPSEVAQRTKNKKKTTNNK